MTKIKKYVREHIHFKKFIIAYVIIFSILCLGYQVRATGTTNNIGDNETESLTNLENDVPFSMGVTVDTSNDEGSLAGTLQMLLVLTVISLAPSIVVMMTSFTRIIVVFHFLRTAL
ncbi:MAG: hypothetical protein PUC12_02875, partial [Clostridiales bacterium]|nr:hypothetical protein [Clostridiales bacterium]